MKSAIIAFAAKLSDSSQALMNKRLINPPGSERTYKVMRFSQAVRVADTIWVSGQVGMDKDGRIPEGLKEQAELAFENLRTVLEAAGSSLADIVELTTYHRDLGDARAFSRVKNRFFTEDYPAWTAVGVTELVYPDLLLEIKAVAVAGCGAS